MEMDYKNEIKNTIQMLNTDKDNMANAKDHIIMLRDEKIKDLEE